MRHKTYAVWWQEGSGQRHAGKLQLGRLHLLLSGNGSGGLVLPLDQIVEVVYGRGELEIAQRDGTRLRIGNLDGVGALVSGHQDELGVAFQLDLPLLAGRLALAPGVGVGQLVVAGERGERGPVTARADENRQEQQQGSAHGALRQAKAA